MEATNPGPPISTLGTEGAHLNILTVLQNYVGMSLSEGHFKMCSFGVPRRVKFLSQQSVSGAPNVAINDALSLKLNIGGS